MIKYIFCLFLMVSCASQKSVDSTLAFNSSLTQQRSYLYNDVSGNFQVTRLAQSKNNRLLLQRKMFSEQQSKLVEQVRLVSQLGSMTVNGKTRLGVRPNISQFLVWLEGKEYFSQIKVDLKKKKYVVTLKEKYEENPLVSEHETPKTNFLCYFHQIPECLKAWKSLDYLTGDTAKDFSFWILWESYPFTDAIFSDISNELFSQATVKLEEQTSSSISFVMEVQGQVISYQFSKDGNFEKMSWVAQGVSMNIK
jgi:hypothetical protein